MRKSRIICFIVLLAVCVSVCFVSASGEMSVIREGILSYAVQESGVSDAQTFADEILPKRIGVDAEWYILALSREDKYDLSAYANALVSYVNENTVANAVTRQKYALALLASGYTSDFVQKTADECVGKLGIMSLVWALHLAENGYVPQNMTTAQIVDRLLTFELDGGGFAITGRIFSPDATAMALQALAPYAESENVGAVVERALDTLSLHQTENGGFIAYGEENAESSAQVLIMMACLDIPLDDPRFVKNGNSVLDALLMHRCENGGFAHVAHGEVSESASVQAYLALTSLENGSAFRTDHSDGLKEIVYTAEKEAEKENGVSWRVYACAIIGFLVALACLIFTVCGKRKAQNYLLVLIVGAILCALVFVLNIESADGYYEGADKPKENVIGTVTLEIRCDVISEAGSSHVPADGTVLSETTFALSEGESVFDILEQASRKYRIHTEHDRSGKMAYIRGIAYIYELEYGDLSGWIYRVNGESPSVGCGSYILSDGDRIVWHYSLEQGEDIP